MAECDECFICFESYENDTLGRRIPLHTEGCGCSHTVHQWCLVKWYVIYSNYKDECPLCKMPGEIYNIHQLCEQFQDRLRSHPLANIDELPWIPRYRQRRYRAYMYLSLVLLCIIFGYLYTADHTQQYSYYGPRNTTLP